MPAPVPLRTQVAIAGAGPAGLVLAHLLARRGIESVVLEAQSRAYVEGRIRAGVLEQGTADLLVELGAGARMLREGHRHNGIELRFNRISHRIDLSGLTGGRAITVYGQQEVVKDLIAARLAAGGSILFEAEALGFAGLESERPAVRFRHGGAEHTLTADFIAGCDGFHGVARAAVPHGRLRTYERVFPFAWLGILAQAPPTADELVYVNHERGFALHSMRSPELSRLYVQCGADDVVADWPDERVWSELRTRSAIAGPWRVNEGPVLEKVIAGMRSFVTEPMQWGRLYLAGDAAHIVPATGAKGLNLAVADVCVLARGLIGFYRSGDAAALTDYSATCLKRVWRAQRFSSWMTGLLHRFETGEVGFAHKLQLAELDYVTSSTAAATTLAENYVGFPLPAV
jgi:p-hydroxybenzoate 3-monooxygenase